MFSFLKYLPLVTLFQDVTAKIEAEGLAGRPWYLQRTVVGAILVALAKFLEIQFGVKIDPTNLDNMNMDIITVITIIIKLWGFGLATYGVIARAGKENKLAMQSIKMLKMQGRL